MPEQLEIFFGNEGPHPFDLVVVTHAMRTTSSAVRRDLPGWKLSAQGGQRTRPLRRKFLGGTKPFVRRARTTVPDSSTSDNARKVVRVEPVEDGPAKVADFKNGKITIVQG